MALLGFKDRFVPLIQSGAKRHTIRGFRADIKVGTRLDLYARPRQKGMRLIFRAPCVRIEPILIRAQGGCDLTIRLGESWLTVSEKILFARADGFKDADDMALYWRELRPEEFSGLVYHWDFEKRAIEKRAA